jgi:hypothetical protein
MSFLSIPPFPRSFRPAQAKPQGESSAPTFHPTPRRIVQIRRDQRLGRTVIRTVGLVVTAPALSVARTVRSWVPVATFLQRYE